MRVYHLNCGTCCPFGGKLMDGRSRGLEAKLVCHCLLCETDEGLILVDTGFGLQDMLETTPRLSPALLGVLRPRMDPEETAVRQVRKLGFSPKDVRHIVITHLDFDHAGGIGDFPHALVHVLMDEFQAAAHPDSPLARRRFRPIQWESIDRFRFYPRGEGDTWFGFEAVRGLEGVTSEVLLVPLVGHTRGHCGVAVNSERGWLLNAGDAYFYRGEMDPDRYQCTLGLRGYQRLMEVDRKTRLWNQERLRDLARYHPEVDIFCAHDAVELEARVQYNPRPVPTAQPTEHVPSPS